MLLPSGLGGRLREVNMPADSAIDVENYREEMGKILAKHGLGPENLQFVERFENDPNPLRIARNMNIVRKIIFKKNISPEERRAAIAALHRFEKPDLDLLNDDLAFVSHVLLHEICRIISRWRNEYECDKWAFYELKNMNVD